MKSRLVHKGSQMGGRPGSEAGDGRPHAMPRGTVMAHVSVHKGHEPNKRVGEGRRDPSQKGQTTGPKRDARAEHGMTSSPAGVVGVSAPLSTRQASQRASTNNSVMEAGEYGSDVGSTLHTPGTHAPRLNGPNTVPRFATGSNGVNPGSPVGPGGTFPDRNHPFDAEGKEFDARHAAAVAVSNLKGAKVERLSRPK